MIALSRILLLRLNSFRMDPHPTISLISIYCKGSGTCKTKAGKLQKQKNKNHSLWSSYFLTTWEHKCCVHIWYLHMIYFKGKYLKIYTCTFCMQPFIIYITNAFLTTFLWYYQNCEHKKWLFKNLKMEYSFVTDSNGLYNVSQ